VSALLRSLHASRRFFTRHTSDPIHRAIYGAASLSMGVRIAGLGLSYVANVLLSRLLGLAGYGQYAIVLSWVLVLMLPAKAGFDNSALRYSSIYFERGESGALRGFIRLATASVVVVSLIMGGALLVAGPLFIRADPKALIWAGLMVLPFALLALYSVMLRTARRVVAAQFYEQMLRPILIVAGVGAAALAGLRLTASSAMMITCVAAYGALFMLLFHFLRIFRHGRLAPPDYEPWRQWLSVSVPLLIMGVLQELLNQIDIILLGALADARQAALFSASWRLASLIPFALVALATMAGPMIASAFDRGATADLRSISRFVARVGFAFALVGSLLVLLTGKWLLGIFGAEFVRGFPVLSVLLVGGIVNAFTGIVSYFMTLTGHERQAVVIFVGALVVSVALNVLLIPHFGAVGAATASSAALIAYNLVMLIYVRRAIGIDASALSLAPRPGR